MAAGSAPLLHHRLGVAPTMVEQPELAVALGSVAAASNAPTPVSPPPTGSAAQPSPTGASTSGQPAGGHAESWPPSDDPASQPVAATQRQRAPRRRLLVVAVIVAVLFGAAALRALDLTPWNNDPNVPTGPSPGGTRQQDGSDPAAARGGAAQQIVEVKKSVWYSGFKYTFGRAMYQRDQRPPLTIEAQVQNLGLRNANVSTEATFSIGDNHTTGQARTVTVPAQERGDVVFEFAVERLDGSLADGVLTFGDAQVNRTVVPLGAGPGLVAHEPRRVLDATTVTIRDLSIDVRSCELRTDIVNRHEQAPAEHRVVACWMNARYPGPSRFHDLDEELFRLKAPDGSTLSPTEHPGQNLWAGVPVNNFLVAFVVKEPAKGEYVLQVVDLHSSEQLTPDRIRDVPITI